MRSKIIISGLLASAMLAPAAFAQQPNAPANPPAAATMTQTAPMGQSGQWRVSKLMGLNVYNEQNEKLGDISEILMDQSGKVAGVVIGVGGFLGMGQRDIMVTMDKLKFMNEPVRTSTTTTTTPAATTGAGAPAKTTATTTRTNDTKWTPDHAVLAGATKDQLKAMTEFKYN